MYPPVASSHKIFLGMIAWIAVITLLAGLVLWKKPIEAASDLSPTPVVTQPVQAAATPPAEYRALLPVIHKDYLAGP